MILGDLKPILTGKVRDLYEVGTDRLLFVASDRISAFDHVLGSLVPDKGKVLTQLSLFWFDYLRNLVPNHLITADVRDYPADLQVYSDALRGRSMIVQRARMVQVECVARGYLSGSGWKDYQQTGAVCGIALPSGLRESDRLPEPIFTPAAKNHTGHDENVGFDHVVDAVGPELAERLRSLTLAIYGAASKYAESKGLILADTKFEFGFVPSKDGGDLLVLADEVLTPDSSRYWLASGYAPGGAQPSFDKQFVRDYLERIQWNKQLPAPALPDEVVEETRAKYLQAFTLLTGKQELPE
ncbi:phosphoribosylaminoimidazole-succinocarboxamide synthase [Terriglobus roseus DSM 18391]|uniref:Phosphoribosylaminoimidazole-succinocarboxamide synthase n=1 Tax=Terriglobus roseus (strain DSM 18391 / NRRL B-41598 / KBS 63) TaxID=926566 RepID=I3ZFR9_TERRK|nr:phosphoribosylaminoimidazolesuccinocarboxamide synthase [Terriglobus roseus]AFL88087.1 phosphoribosylaminoimidazole-succinocarboxamide synthase [Terriglobus roseus DSM 18391]